MHLEISQRNMGSTSVKAVNARELHKTLNIIKKFADWIKAQIKRAGFEEDVDFITIPQKGKREVQGFEAGSNRIDYYLTVDAAKHIAMMSQSKKAKELRDYFIEVERRYLHGGSELQQIVMDQNRTIAELSKRLNVLPETGPNCFKAPAYNATLDLFGQTSRAADDILKMAAALQNYAMIFDDLLKTVVLHAPNDGVKELCKKQGSMLSFNGSYKNPFYEKRRRNI